MNAETNAPSRAEIFDEASKWGVGGGILLTALAPLSLPIVVLSVVALLPLVVPLIALGLVAAVLALPVMVIRRLGRSLRATGSSRGSAEKPSARPAAGH